MIVMGARPPRRRSDEDYDENEAGDRYEDDFWSRGER